jgi:hypothetical protein
MSVTKIYNYYKKHGYKTVVMGASFRNKVRTHVPRMLHARPSNVTRTFLLCCMLGSIDRAGGL